MVNRTNDKLGMTTTTWEDAEYIATVMHEFGHVASDEKRGIAIIEGCTLSRLIAIERKLLDEHSCRMRLYTVASIVTDILESLRRELAERIFHVCEILTTPIFKN